MTKPIPKEELRANQIRFERHVASVLLAALSESGLEISEIEARLGHKKGFFKRYVSRLMDGATNCGYPATDISHALGFELKVGYRMLHEVMPEPEE